MSSKENMTPFQRTFPKEVQREAYQRLPMTCDKVREILDQAQEAIMFDLDIDEADTASVDAILSQVFMQIRDEVTQKFRDEQMELLNCCR